MTYVVEKCGKGRYVVIHRYARENVSRETTSHAKAQRQADQLNRAVAREGLGMLRADSARVALGGRGRP